MKKSIQFISCFFRWFGHQNHYAWDETGQEEGLTRKPHLWKTRFGFSTAWRLAKIICS
jgi:hypothetical protein